MAKMTTTPNLREQMGRAIAETAEAQGMTQAEFARRVGASTKHVNQVFTGTKVAYMETLEYWAFVLGCHFTVALKKGRG